jgi:hypothetical protein
MLKQKKDDLHDKASSLAQTLEALNKSLLTPDLSKPVDLDVMDNVPEHIKKEVNIRFPRCDPLTNIGGCRWKNCWP